MDDQRDYAEEQYNLRTMHEEEDGNTCDCGDMLCENKTHPENQRGYDDPVREETDEPESLHPEMQRHYRLDNDNLERHIVTCGECGQQWCEICTPGPSARCPFEYDHG